MAKPVPYPIGGGEVALDYTFPAAEDMAADGWVLTGDDLVIDWWDSPHSFPYINGAVLFFWTDLLAPFFRSSFHTVMASDLGMTPLTPGQRVQITVRAAWNLGTGFDSGAWVGMEVNGVRGTVNGPMFGGPVREFTIDVEADEDGDFEIKIGVDRMNPSLNVEFSWRSFQILVGAFDSDPFLDIIQDTAVLFEDGIPISISRDGFAFDPQHEWENHDFPGKTAPVDGLDELVGQQPVLRGAFMLTGERPIEQYDPGGAWANHATISGGRTYTPAAMRAALATSFTLTNVICIWKRLRGDYIAVEFPKAICRRYGVHGADRNEGLIDVEIEARQDLSGGITPKTTRLYKIHTFPITFTAEELSA